MTTNKQRTRPRSKLRRRVAGLLALGIALLSAGALYAVFTPQPQMANAAEDPALIRQGEQIYNTSCISCHGANLQGEKDRGTSLIGVGGAAVYFQVSSGRMPMVRQEAQAERKPAKFNPEEIDALVAFVQSRGGGPARPEERGEALRGADPARGGELFRLNCASCHNFTGRGGALSSGKFAPTLDGVTEDQLYTAMLTGPQNMPKFSDRQLSPEEKKDIIAYVKSVTDGRNNPGGNALGGYGPGPEGLIAWIVGIAALVGVTLWIGSKA
ncbi:ubiquinol-cytochrome c reductase cytochrome c subunit [Streptoalloteichus tenebrarius]|uniref:Cytochrome bc1 complex cytochrome c subunit n=1 Tax=Streptoalloteichus tenebrarius (strain ATCC 17920 / DSM 40477 / JCM 4838 / CBS 697.72 / NBRC 16177 / NCIMB 11028 / NRRL B-12390 / A12253. 1 / ISP 5477) TaxID=1933 RepID=A0ABT1HX52_STRSD|nr:cytochrome c [Streptoalloteichus tenebrarius]MCP2260093.1 ubiquinol-cytochrome c reductase cytochrome c subunit [Streptoalloteichus tenebrarius]